MLEQLKTAKRIVGIKQIQKALSEARVETVFFAEDADPNLLAPVLSTCEAQGLRTVPVPEKRKLGQACGIDVAAAAAAILK